MPKNNLPPKYRNLIIILLLGALNTITPFAIDFYLPAFPQIAKAMQSSVADVSLSLSSYFVGLAFGQIIYGPLLDRFGRRVPLCIGLMTFILASIGCAMTTSVHALIVLRFIQALGGCAAGVGSTAMVRDFFPVKESSKIFSIMTLILGVSPLIAPSVGSLIATTLGWQWVFLLIAILALVILALVFLYLPEGHAPDKSISLKAGPILHTFWAILKEPQFLVYTMAGSLSTASLLTYATGSPIIFMDMFQVSIQTYGLIFAFLSVGFMSGNQINIFLTKKFTSDKIFKAGIWIQIVIESVLLLGTLNGWYGLYETIGILFVCLACIGLTNPNGMALSLAPFQKNAGSASALFGFIQTGISALASTGVAFFHARDASPIVGIMLSTTLIGFVFLMIGKRQIRRIKRSAAKEAEIMA